MIVCPRGGLPQSGPLRGLFVVCGRLMMLSKMIRAACDDEATMREFVFVPGDTVTLGWKKFAVGLNQESREELEYLFREWEFERDPKDFIRESMAPVRQADIPPMLVGRELEEIGWEPVQMDDPRLRPDWLEDFRKFAATDRDSLTLAGRARFEREGDGWQVCLYHETDYLDFQKLLEKQGLSLPTADEWAYLCGGGCNICGGMGPFLGFLPCSPHYKPEVQEDNELNGDYDFYRPVIRVELD